MASEETPRQEFKLPPPFSRAPSSLNISVTAHDLAIGSWVDQSQDTALPLQPIPASHPVNHHANAATSSANKGDLPMPSSTFASRGGVPLSVYQDDASHVRVHTSAGELSIAGPELSGENVFPDVVDPVVGVDDTVGYPLQHYPNVTEVEADIYEDDGRTSRAGQRYHDVDACYDVRDPFPKYAYAFDAEDERKMVVEYIDYLVAGEVWAKTATCGAKPFERQHGVPCPLHATLLTNMFAAGVNDAWTATGGYPCFHVDAISVYEYRPPPVGVRVAEEGTLHALLNVRHSRALPFHYCCYSWLRELAREFPLPPVQAAEEEEPLIFVGDEVVEGELGEPEAAECDGEYDETETF